MRKQKKILISYDGNIFLIKLSKRISRYPHINVRVQASLKFRAFKIYNSWWKFVLDVVQAFLEPIFSESYHYIEYSTLNLCLWDNVTPSTAHDAHAQVPFLLDFQLYFFSTKLKILWALYFKVTATFWTLFQWVKNVRCRV